MDSNIFMTIIPGLSNWVNNLLEPLWLKIAEGLGKVASDLVRKIFADGVYEVLDYESTLEILNQKGTKARFSKTKKIRYLQNNVIAYQDYAWGDGNILLDYQTSRGFPVDRYRSGYKTYILISLREVKNKGDLDEFNIQWNIRQGFLTSDGYWGIVVSQRTFHIKMNVIFPKSRPPIQIKLEENTKQRTNILSQDCQKQLADGRWQVTWEMKNPSLHELYVIRWIW